MKATTFLRPAVYRRVLHGLAWYWSQEIAICTVQEFVGYHLDHQLPPEYREEVAHAR